MSTKRSDIRKPQVDGWAELAISQRREPGQRCGQCLACRYGDICASDPRHAIEPKSDGRLYRKDGRTGLWEVVP